MDYVIHRDSYVTLAGEVVGQCLTDAEGRAIVEFFDVKDMPPAEARFTAWVGEWDR